MLRPRGLLFVLGFDESDDGQGPGVSKVEIRDAFTDGWRVETIDESIFETVGVENHKRRAWLTMVRATERAG